MKPFEQSSTAKLAQPQRTQRTQRKTYEIKFAWSQDAARRKSKPTFLLSAVSAFFAFFAV